MTRPTYHQLPLPLVYHARPLTPGSPTPLGVLSDALIRKYPGKFPR